jgi:hypothetical protein
MAIIFPESTRLGGSLIGIGIKHKDGSEDFRWLDKPIHNRIVSGGLDYLLTSRNSTTGGYSFGITNSSNAGSPRPAFIGCGYTANSGDDKRCQFGACQFFQVGTGGKATEFNDTSLEVPFDTPKNSYRNETPFSGVRYISHNKHAVRIAHRQLISQDITIRELGWFGGIGPTDYPSFVATQNILFSRVVLDQPISLLAGEYFQAVYEIELDFGGETSGEFQNLTDQDNKIDPLKFLSRPYIVPYGRSTSATLNNRLYNCFDLSNGSSGYNHAGEFHLPVAYATGVRGWPSTAYVDGIFYNTNDRDFTEESKNSRDTNVTPIFNTSGDKSVEFVDYAGIGNNDKHRDMIWKIGALCPNLNPDTFIDFRFLRLRGREYRFGYYEADGTTWHSQALRKYANQTLAITHRVRFSTPDTI